MTTERTLFESAAVPCKSCQRSIIWIQTIKGARMPCDPATVTVVTPDGETVRGHIPHWSTCPTADQHRVAR